MKGETKVLFEDLRSLTKIAFKDLQSCLTYIHLDENKILGKIDDLESKIKEMEVYLTKGGIILDRNGKQCHVGDKVKWISEDEETEGVLIFYENLNRLFVDNTKDGFIYNPIQDRIELIEE